MGPARENEMRRDALSGTSIDSFQTENSIGEYLHALEDSYSHQSDPHRRDFSKTYHSSGGGGQAFASRSAFALKPANLPRVDGFSIPQRSCARMTRVIEWVRPPE